MNLRTSQLGEGGWMKRRRSIFTVGLALVLSAVPGSAAQADGPFGESYREFYVGPGAYMQMSTYLNIDFGIAALRGYGNSYSYGYAPSVMSYFENRISVFRDGVRVQSGNVATGCGSYCSVDNSTFLFYCEIPAVNRGYRSYNKTRVYAQNSSFQDFELYSGLVATACTN